MKEETSKVEPKIYIVNFEEYLRPKQAFKIKELQSFKIQKYDNPKIQSKLPENKNKEVHKRAPYRWQTWIKHFKKVKRRFLNRKLRFHFHMPDFLGFLRPQKNEDICRRKTGFEIYCEMASIHGFKNFVDSKPSTRIFWALVIGLALYLGLFVINKSFKINNETPTILYTESIADKTFDIPIPAITICNLNRISQNKAIKVAEKFLPHSSLPRHEILRLLPISLYARQELNVTKEDLLAFELLLNRNNYTITSLLKEISPKCGDDALKLCKERGHHERCQRMLREVYTSAGVCCSLNYFADGAAGESASTAYSQSCGHQTGLAMLMNPNVNNYNVSIQKFPGYEVYIHDVHDIPNELTEKQIINAHTETMISVTPLSAYGTHYLNVMKKDLRGCYFPGEYKLKYAQFYTLSNCLAECRSHLMHEKCGCIPPFWLKLAKKWKFCQTAVEISCVLANKEIFGKVSEVSESKTFVKRQSQKFICNCLPLCGYNQYSSIVESTPLDRNFSLVDKRLFKSIRNIGNFTLLYIFYGDLIAERYRHDVTESWISALGKVGGIAGLYMGYSIISMLEVIFFIFIRPICNWMTKQQIRFQKMRNQREKNEAQKGQIKSLI